MHAHLSRQILLPNRWHYSKELIPIRVLRSTSKAVGHPTRTQPGARAIAAETAESASIYVVGDELRLTNMYTVILGGAGYVVQAFNDRAEALTMLKAESKKPQLLITDCSGHTLPAERFLQRCLHAHPFLKILVASGCNQARSSYSVTPNRFLQKPFTAEKFLEEVRAVLSA